MDSSSDDENPPSKWTERRNAYMEKLHARAREVTHMVKPVGILTRNNIRRHITIGSHSDATIASLNRPSTNHFHTRPIDSEVEWNAVRKYVLHSAKHVKSASSLQRLYEATMKMHDTFRQANNKSSASNSRNIPSRAYSTDSDNERSSQHTSSRYSSKSSKRSSASDAFRARIQKFKSFDILASQDFDDNKAHIRDDDAVSVESLNKRFDEEKRVELFKRFRKAVKKLLNILNLLTVSRRKNSEIENVAIFNVSQKANKEIFDKSLFKRAKEQLLSDEIKKILQLDFSQKTEDSIRLAVAAINHIVPEFDDFPSELQRSLVKYGVFEEYEPGRVILRQGHLATNYYFIISGSVVVTVAAHDELTGETINRPITFLKRGNTFGDTSLIDNTRRASTVITHGDRSICLLSIHKDDFFKVLTPLSNPEEKRRFLSQRVNIFGIVDYPIEKLTNSQNSCHSVYFRKGTVICNDSDTDKWLYIVKTGVCRVMKTIHLNELTKKNYENARHKRELNYEKVINLHKNLDSFKINQKDNKKEQSKSKPTSANKSNGVQLHLEIEKLKEGDIFGLRDLLYSDALGVNSFMLVSEGVECILINRKIFLKHISETQLEKLKHLSVPYPNDALLMTKYYDALNWSSYKKSTLSKTISNISLKK